VKQLPWKPALTRNHATIKRKSKQTQTYTQILVLFMHLQLSASAAGANTASADRMLPFQAPGNDGQRVPLQHLAGQHMSGVDVNGFSGAACAVHVDPQPTPLHWSFWNPHAQVRLRTCVFVYAHVYM
jgi:hypothetical protein